MARTHHHLWVGPGNGTGVDEWATYANRRLAETHAHLFAQEFREMGYRVTGAAAYGYEVLDSTTNEITLIYINRCQQDICRLHEEIF